ncbi:aminotransferase class V-fold PLP-dependent enzyme, partial [Mesorhizobium sp. M2C.T.Ca.TU.002.02.1.1]|uniref:aminotransferase class V-fold PLP-dependent enzyme n=1 Tax=Mesorhizobium sp. M2C.T.Ca.TU.002.02.1.1 TaxID=2496788 RepID=UPI000FCA1CA8
MSGYFLYHSIGTFPGKAEAMGAALAEFSAIWSAENDGQWPAALAARQRFIDAWTRLIEAPKGTLTTAENVTAALYSLIGGLPAERLAGKRLLVAGDCFPSLHFLLAGLAERFGFTLDTVPLRAGESWVRDEDFIARWQDDVGLALITFVTSTASHRCDVERLAAHGRAMGSIVGVDVTQGIGVAPFSVAATPVDFVVSTSLKWLCGSSGAGIVQVAPELLATCRPELRGWFSQPNPFSWDLDAFAYADDARRFDHGTPAILASIASLPGLEWVEKTGIDAIRAQNAVLVERIIGAALDNGWTLRSPLDAGERGGSVMLGLPQGVEAAKIIASLRNERLYCDARGTTLRLSPGIVTTEAAVDALIAGLQD